MTATISSFRFPWWQQRVVGSTFCSKENGNGGTDTSVCLFSLSFENGNENSVRRATIKRIALDFEKNHHPSAIQYSPNRNGRIECFSRHALTRPMVCHSNCLNNTHPAIRHSLHSLWFVGEKADRRRLEYDQVPVIELKNKNSVELRGQIGLEDCTIIVFLSEYRALQYEEMTSSAEGT